MNALKRLEVEFKYRADEISLSDFTDLCDKRNPINFILASGYDYFYSDTKNADSFARHRVGQDYNQLTFKRKKAENNNYIRTEHNVFLGNGADREQIEALCAEFGYKFNTVIFKNAFIYEYDTYILVYYIVYDKGLKEIGRFIEIEMREEYPWNSEKEAWDGLTLIEQDLKPLGVVPQSRVKKSLFEQFKKDVD